MRSSEEQVAICRDGAGVLIRFFANGEVKMFSEVVFDYAKRTEKFEP